MKCAGAAAEELLERVDLTTRFAPLVHLPMGAMMLFARAKKRARFDASDPDRMIASMLAYGVTRGPIVKLAIC